MITGRLKRNILTGRLKKTVEVVQPTLENLEITPSKQEQTFNHPNSDGYDEVKVNAVTSEIDTNIIPENIKENVSILGVRGTYVGAKYKPKHISFYQYKGTDLNYELANLDTSLVTNMADMFAYNQKITSLDLSKFDTSNVTTMRMMFYNAEKLTSLDLSNFDTSNVTDMNNLCTNCYKLATINVKNFNTSKVTTMSSTFSNCETLTSLDLSNWDTSQVTDIYGMFQGCESLKYLDIRNFTFSSKITDYRYMLRYVPTDCLIIVKSETEKAWLKSKFSSYTNVKTVAEIGG